MRKTIEPFRNGYLAGRDAAFDAVARACRDGKRRADRVEESTDPAGTRLVRNSGLNFPPQ